MERNSKGHFVKGHKSLLTKESGIKISLALKGKKKPPFTEEHKRKMRESYKYHAPALGKHLSEESKRKISLAKKGIKTKPCSEETKRKIGDAQMGCKNHRFGKHQTEEWKNRISKMLSGENAPNWQGGISREPYSVDWSKTLKRAIRERQHYICGICRLPQEDRALDVHHIDYNKKNCNPDNLIALHHSCHTKTSFNRDYWINYFKNK